MTDQKRAALYAVLAAITALIVAYGLITQDAAALLLARRNVPSVIAKRATPTE